MPWKMRVKDYPIPTESPRGAYSAPRSEHGGIPGVPRVPVRFQGNPLKAPSETIRPVHLPKGPAQYSGIPTQHEHLVSFGRFRQSPRSGWHLSKLTVPPEQHHKSDRGQQVPVLG
jgi:hypothetical protein